MIKDQLGGFTEDMESGKVSFADGCLAIIDEALFQIYGPPEKELSPVATTTSTVEAENETKNDVIEMIPFEEILALYPDGPKSSP